MTVTTRAVSQRARKPGKTLGDLAVPVVLIAVFTSTWGALSVSGLQLVDLFLVLAAVMIGLDAVTGSKRLWVPRWVGIPTLIILGIAVLHVFTPTPTNYMSNRFMLLQTEAVTGSEDGTVATVLIAVRWCIAIAILPLLVAYLARMSPGFLTRVGYAWVLGAAVSAAVAVSDWFGITNLGETLLGYVNYGGRQSGLASHANNLGFACVIVTPIAAHMFQTKPKTAVLALVVLAAGAFSTGSRGAQAGMVVALLLSLLILRIGRRAVWWFIAIAIAVLFAVGQLAPQVFGDAASLLRFDGAGMSGDSDLGRAGLGEQARIDFTNYPLTGVSMGIITHAHSVPLQLAAAGGIALIVAMIIYWGGALTTAVRLRREHFGLTMAAGLSIVLWLAQSLVQNQLVDRYLYVSIALIVGVAALQKLGLNDETPRRSPARRRR